MIVFCASQYIWVVKNELKLVLQYLKKKKMRWSKFSKRMEMEIADAFLFFFFLLLCASVLYSFTQTRLFIAGVGEKILTLALKAVQLHWLKKKTKKVNMFNLMGNHIAFRQSSTLPLSPMTIDFYNFNYKINAHTYTQFNHIVEAKKCSAA